MKYKTLSNAFILEKRTEIEDKKFGGINDNFTYISFTSLATQKQEIVNLEPKFIHVGGQSIFFEGLRLLRSLIKNFIILT